MDNNIFELGVLCHLETHEWGNTKRIDQDKLTRKHKWLSASKKLVNRESMEEIHSLVSKARNTVKGKSLPFPIDGIYLIPKNLVSDLANELNIIIEKFDIAVDDFCNDYESVIENARNELSDFFNQEDYPQNIREKFSMKYRLLEMAVPGEMQKFSPEIYQQEVSKFQQTMEETRIEATICMREAFLSILNHLSNVLIGDSDGPRRIRQDTLDRAELFFEEFKSKNIFKDNELETLITNIKDTMLGISSSDLKNSGKLREHVISKVEEITNSLEKSTVKLRRKISL